MSKDEKEICLHCRWWNAITTTGDMGTCRRYAPDRHPSDGMSSACWPITFPEDWCGEFTALPLSDEDRNFLLAMQCDHQAQLQTWEHISDPAERALAKIAARRKAPQ